MKRKLTSFLGVSVLAGSMLGGYLNAEELAATFRSATGKAYEAIATKGKINRNPSSKFNRKPGDPAILQGSGKFAKRSPSIVTSRIPAAANLADYPLLFGLNYTDGTWQTLSPLPAGVFSFQTAAETELVATAIGAEFDRPMAACYGNGKFYVLKSYQREGEDWTTYIDSTIDVYDTETWEKIETLEVSKDTTDWLYYFRQVAAVDSETGYIYSSTWGTDKPLVKIDPKTGDLTEIGPTGRFLQAIFFDDKGQLFGIDFTDSSLYSIDKTTGGNTLIGKLDTDFKFSADAQSIAYNPASGKAIWIGVDSGSKQSYISEISLDNASVEIIATMPGNEHILGLYLPEADAAAPAAPSGIACKDGKVIMKLPSSTYLSGESLSGELAVNLTVDKTNKVTAKGQPGETIEIPMQLADGKHNIMISVANASGVSPLRRLDTFIGDDTPMAVLNLTLELDGNKKFNLTWDAPQKSIHGGAIDDADLNYRIIRYPDETVVAEKLKETSFSEDIPEAHAGYTYLVEAFASDRKGESALSNRVVAGEYWIAPYTETFLTQDDFDSFKVIDANNDLASWSFMDPGSMGDGLAYLNGNGTPDVDTGIYEGNGNDDYLISPFVHLKAGQDYRLRFEIGDMLMWYEHMTILLGTSRDVTGNELKIFSENLEAATVYSLLFSVPSDGDYAFFFHSDQPGPSVNIMLDNISFEEYGVFAGPAHVDNLVATAGELGALTNTLTFNAPSSTYKEGELGELTEIRIYRNSSRHPVKVFENPKAGEALSWTDTDVEQGNVTYRILAYNQAGQGEEAVVTNWVGLDQPANVTGLKLSMNADNKAVATFNASEGRGMHGGYVDNSKVYYALFRYNPYNWFEHWEQATEFTQDLTIVDEDKEIWWGQEYVDYILVAANEAGYSSGVGAGIVLGNPYALPYNESFAFGFASQDPWTLFASSYYYAWNMVNGDGLPVKPYDEDGGMLQFALVDDDSNNQVLSGPRIDLTNGEANELSFQMWHGFEAEEEDLQLIVYLNYDDKGWEEAARIDYNNGMSGWMRHSVPLASDSNNVQIAFGGYAADASAGIYVDAIKIAQSSPCDLAILSTEISSKRLNAGETLKINVAVANYGTETAKDAEVYLMSDDQPIDARVISSLAPSEMTIVEFELPTARDMASKSYSYTAVVEIEGDVDGSNNEGSPVAFYVKGSTLPAPVGLKAEEGSDGVSLTWEAPLKDEMTDPVTEDFESYELFIIDNIGDWTTYDGDGTPTVYFGGPDVPNAYEPKAWQVWGPEAAGFSLEKFDVLTPKSGSQYLTCWAASNGIDATLPNDDWLISSEVTGGTDLSFWYRMPNAGSDPQKFEVLYSTESNEPEDFVAFDSDAITFGTDWVYFEFTLPQDARYFAIRSCVTGSYTVALLDDITYTPLFGSITKLTLEGYNVYRDNELIATRVSEPQFIDNTASEGMHVYNVTSVWAEGESNYSDAADFLATSVNAISGEATVKVSKGIITVKGSVNGSCLLTPAGIKVAASSDADATYNVAPGVYLVKTGNRIAKVTVK